MLSGGLWLYKNNNKNKKQNMCCCLATNSQQTRYKMFFKSQESWPNYSK